MGVYVSCRSVTVGVHRKTGQAPFQVHDCSDDTCTVTGDILELHDTKRFTLDTKQFNDYTIEREAQHDNNVLT